MMLVNSKRLKEKYGFYIAIIGILVPISIVWYNNIYNIPKLKYEILESYPISEFDEITMIIIRNTGTKTAHEVKIDINTYNIISNYKYECEDDVSCSLKNDNRTLVVNMERFIYSSKISLYIRTYPRDTRPIKNVNVLYDEGRGQEYKPIPTLYIQVRVWLQIITLVTAIILFIYMFYRTRKEHRVSRERERESEMVQVVSYNFESDNVGDIPRNWTIVQQIQGTIYVTNELGAEGTSKSLRIQNPENSQDIARVSFNPLEKLTLIYSLRQEFYGNHRGTGNGISLYQGTIQAIYMQILHRKLTGYWENEYHEFFRINLQRWYKIKLDIDCTKQEYYCYVDDELIRRGKFREEVPYIDNIQTADWHNQAERIGYLDEIKILKPSPNNLN